MERKLGQAQYKYNLLLTSRQLHGTLVDGTTGPNTDSSRPVENIDVVVNVAVAAIVVVEVVAAVLVVRTAVLAV